jgi:HD-GYP domain-containing protein (c-di-GMP phosphodiesterase class II)
MLAAADSYHALTEARPHRLPRSGADTVAELRAGVSSGRLDDAAVDAVLRAAGHRTAKQPSRRSKACRTS